MLVMGMLERAVELFRKFRLFGVLVRHNFGSVEFLYLLSEGFLIPSAGILIGDNSEGVNFVFKLPS